MRPHGTWWALSKGISSRIPVLSTPFLMFMSLAGGSDYFFCKSCSSLFLPHFGLQHPWYVSAGYKFQFQRHVTHVLSAEHSSSFGKIQCAWGKVLNARAACTSAPRAPSRPDGRGSCCPPGTRAPHGQSVSMSPRTPTMARRLDLKNGAGPAVAWPQPPRKAASSLIESQNGMERESIAGRTRGCIWERLPTSTSSAARARKPKPGASVGTATPGTG